MLPISWDPTLGIPSPSGPTLFYHGWRHGRIADAAWYTSAELNLYRKAGFTESGARGALAVDWNAKGLRGTGSMGSNWVMHHKPLLLHGGIPADQVILHSGGFKPGWKPKRMPRAQFLRRRLLSRALPGVGWALLAYDAYDILVNRSFWGFKLD